MRFPYGVSDFYKIRTRGDVYIDRTDRIPLLEDAGDSLLFLRPRRFGKSLLLSTLENYYDVAKVADFDRLFGELAIGQNPTPLHNQYLNLRWDFSLVPARPTFEQQQQVLSSYINAEIRAFARKYQDILPEPIDIDETFGTASFISLLSVVQQSGQKLCLLVDEYDNFANEVLMGSKPTNQERYEALVFGEGEFKALFKAIKGAMAGRGLDRVFIVGVSPIVLHDVSSGFNIAKNIYFRQEFNDLCGFTESEIADLLHQVIGACNLPEPQFAEALALMRTYYNGSLFSDERGDSVYNPTSAFYFLDYLQRTCRYPRNMLDSNLAPDQDKIAYIAGLPKGEELILNIVDEREPPALVALEDRFGIKQMLAASNTEDFMLSLLYYLGVLTLEGTVDARGKQLLRVPNLVIQQLYADRLREILLPNAATRDDAKRVAEDFYSEGKLQPLCDFIVERIFPIFDNRDYIQANELTVKTAFLTLLFNDIFYIMDSEEELKRGYADLTMILRPEMRQHQLLDLLMEFKLVKLNSVGLTGHTVREQGEAELKLLEPVQTAFAEARTQAATYRAGLEAKYGNQLKLRTFIVVAIGFERLLWEAVL
jgi:hypothetical protein